MSGIIFFGHGELDRVNGIGNLVFVRQIIENVFGVLHPDPRSAEAVVQTVSQDQRLLLAVICACESAWSDSEHNFELSVVGKLLSNTLLAYVVGIQSVFDLPAARTFISHFLMKITTEPLDVAISNARVEVKAIYPNSERERYSSFDWWIPVVYTRTTDFRLLNHRNPRISVPEVSGSPNISSQIGFPLSGREVNAVANAILEVIKSKLSDSDNDRHYEFSPRD